MTIASMRRVVSPLGREERSFLLASIFSLLVHQGMALSDGPGTLAIWYDQGRERTEMVRGIKEGNRSVIWEVIVDSAGREIEVLDQNLIIRFDMGEAELPANVLSDADRSALETVRARVEGIARAHPAARDYLADALVRFADAAARYDGGSRRRNGIWFSPEEVRRLERAWKKDMAAGSTAQRQAQTQAPKTTVAATAASEAAPKDSPPPASGQMPKVPAQPPSADAVKRTAETETAPVLTNAPSAGSAQSAPITGFRRAQTPEERARDLPYARGLTRKSLSRSSRDGGRPPGGVRPAPPVLSVLATVVCLVFGARALRRRMANKFYVVEQGKVSGPFRWPEMEAMVAGRKLPPNAFFYSGRNKALRPISALSKEG